MTITITATLVPATGLTEIATIRDGVTHAVKWVDLRYSADLTHTVPKAAREAIGDQPNTITGNTIKPDFYSMTIELGHPDA